MNIDEYQNFLREQISRIHVAGRQTSSDFLIWFLQNHFNLDKDDAISCVCDNSNDKGIDGIVVDNTEQEIHVFQSKFKENNDRDIGDRVLRDFAGVRQWFQNPESISKLLDATINRELKNLILFNRLIDIIDDYSVEYHFISNAFKNHDTKEFMDVTPDINVFCIEWLHKNYHFIAEDPLVVFGKYNFPHFGN